jgi:hypothetical protein
MIEDEVEADVAVTEDTVEDKTRVLEVAPLQRPNPFWQVSTAQ